MFVFILGSIKWGLCKKVTMGDECGCQEFEACDKYKMVKFKTQHIVTFMTLKA